MTRRKRRDLYPEFHVTFVKDKRIDDVTPVSLSDLGFQNDVYYRNQSRGELSKDIACAIEEEFIFLIEELLPRNIQDLFYKIGLDPRPAYWEFFESAGNDLGLERYTDKDEYRFNQFVSHAENGIMELISEGWKLSEIYENTCVTKNTIYDVVYGVKRPAYSKRSNWNNIEIEAALFKQNLQYELNVSLPISDKMEYQFDFVIYRDSIPVVVIHTVDELDFLLDVDLELQKEHETLYNMLHLRTQYCDKQNITLLRMYEKDCFELEDSMDAIVRKVLADPEYVKIHDKEVLTMIKEEKEEEELW